MTSLCLILQLLKKIFTAYLLHLRRKKGCFPDGNSALILAAIESPQSYCIGDITDDGSIDFQDVQIFLPHLNTKADWYKP